jgi:hypothetical protein
MVGHGAPAGLLERTGTPFLRRATGFGVSACLTRSDTTLPVVVRRATASSFAASSTSSSRSSVVRIAIDHLASRIGCRAAGRRGTIQRVPPRSETRALFGFADQRETSPEDRVLW